MLDLGSLVVVVVVVVAVAAAGAPVSVSAVDVDVSVGVAVSLGAPRTLRFLRGSGGDGSESALPRPRRCRAPQFLTRQCTSQGS